MILKTYFNDVEKQIVISSWPYKNQHGMPAYHSAVQEVKSLCDKIAPGRYNIVSSIDKTSSTYNKDPLSSQHRVSITIHDKAEYDAIMSTLQLIS
jgi:hypothetical protein